MKTESNTYTFLYASVLVIVFAAILTTAALLLQKRQQRNIEVEKKQQILASLNIESTPQNAEALYKKYIVESFIINYKGEKLQGDAFNIDLKKELAKPLNERQLPVFYGKLDDGGKKIIVPLHGKGLWGPIWGYVSLQDDYSTINGAMFDHKSETPGLGAEINKGWFQAPFKSKKIFDANGTFTSILIVKGGAKKDDPHGVDAISGGTITSKGLEAMLKDCLSNYKTYFKNQKNN